MKNNPAVHHGRGVEAFVAEHVTDVTGVICGFDRLRLRASLRWLYQPSFMKRYLCEAGVLLKDFGAYATALSNRIRAAGLATNQTTPEKLGLHAPFVPRTQTDFVSAGVIQLRVDALTGTAASAKASAARVRQGAWAQRPYSRWHRSFPSPSLHNLRCLA